MKGEREEKQLCAGCFFFTHLFLGPCFLQRWAGARERPRMMRLFRPFFVSLFCGRQNGKGCCGFVVDKPETQAFSDGHLVRTPSPADNSSTDVLGYAAQATRAYHTGIYGFRLLIPTTISCNMPPKLGTTPQAHPL